MCSQPIGFAPGEPQFVRCTFNGRMHSSGQQSIYTQDEQTARDGMALLEAVRRCASDTTAAAISGYQQQLASISFLEDGTIIFRAAARPGLQHRPAESTRPSHPRRVLFVSML